MQAIFEGEVSRHLLLHPRPHHHLGAALARHLPQCRRAHAVPIQPSSDDAFHLIGGAGGKLNYLKLTGVRSEEEYAQRQRDSAKARREQKQERRKRDREAGLSNSKAAAVQQLRLTAQQARNDFIKRVAVALGWKPGCAAEFTAPATRRAPMCSTTSGASTIRGGGIRPLAVSALWISRRWPRQAKLGVHRNASRP